MSSAALVLGPLLRYVDTTSASVWVETAAAATVTLECDERRWEARTFGVHGHHYALIEVDDLAPGTDHAYRLLVEGQVVWPEPDSAYPAPVVRTLADDGPLRIAFGSCRVSVPHDAEHHASFGVDALRGYAHHLAGVSEDSRASQPDSRAPDLLLFLGDQVYADETSEAMRRFIAARRDPEQAPWWELKDYEEYAELYRLAWSDPANRWLLSTVPSAMIFDDHDVRDDWNTSARWRADMARTSWWHGRIVGALASYWVHQHLGNLSPADRARDPLWQRVVEHSGPEELDLGAELDAFAERADAEPTAYRWSYARDYGTRARLVVVDSRAGRVLEPERRSMLDEQEMEWLDGQLRGDVDHLLIGTSLPFLLAPGIHHVEALTEALAEGLLGRAGHELGEKVRRAADTEHWAAFQDGFTRVGTMTREVAAGERGRAPSTVVFLSGDVHHSYLAEAWPDPSSGVTVNSRVLQAVCSPIRNPLPRFMKTALRIASTGRARPTGRLLGRRIPASPMHWRVTHGPWFDNNLAVLETDGEDLRMWWTTAEVVDGRHDRPVLRRVADLAEGVRRR